VLIGILLPPRLSSAMAKKHTILEFKSPHAIPVREICLAHGNKPDALLEILHDVQEKLGYVPESELPTIANALNISRAEAYGVATFYHDFHLKPIGKHVLKICRAEACQSMGSAALISSVENFLKVKMGGTTADGLVTLEATYCLGLCASAPALMIDNQPKARMNSAKAEILLKEIGA
jgi:formate dehydrogenase subunit gamma